MTINVEIRPEVQADLARQAASRGAHLRRQILEVATLGDAAISRSSPVEFFVAAVERK